MLYAHINRKEYKDTRGTGKITINGDFILGSYAFTNYICSFSELSEVKFRKSNHGGFFVDIISNKLKNISHSLHIKDKETADELYGLLTERAINAVHYNLVPEEPNFSEQDALDNVARCPDCGSTSLSANKRGFDVLSAVTSHLIGGLGVLSGSIGMNDIVVACLRCGNKFEPGK